MRNHIYDWDQDHPGTKWIVSIALLLIALLFVASSARGQFGVEQPMFALTSSTAPFTPSDVPSIRYWWKAGDLVDGSTVTVWTDRIAGLNLTNATANAPTNSASGVWFSGATWLDFKTNFAVIAGTGNASTSSVFVVFTPITAAAAEGSIIAVGNNGSSELYGLRYQPGGNLTYSGEVGFFDFGKYSSGRIMDLLLVLTQNNPYTTLTYTNNISGGSGSGGGWFNAWRVGWNNQLNRFYKGYVTDIIFFTNAVSSVTASNLHWYATNSYGITP